jgi:hypothetical protein
MARVLTPIIPDRCCCKRGYAAATASLAVQSFDILLGTGALLFGASPSLRSSGTGTAEDGGASPLASECSSRFTSARFRDELS